MQREGWISQLLRPARVGVRTTSAWPRLLQSNSAIPCQSSEMDLDSVQCALAIGRFVVAET